MRKQRNANYKSDKNNNKTNSSSEEQDFQHNPEVSTSHGSTSSIDQRVANLEQKLNSNEQFANLMVDCLLSQTIVSESVRDILRRSLRDDGAVHDELSLAIQTYDRAKFRRAFSGFLGVLLWMISIIVAAFVGALIHWTFSGGGNLL